MGDGAATGRVQVDAKGAVRRAVGAERCVPGPYAVAQLAVVRGRDQARRVIDRRRAVDAEEAPEGDVRSARRLEEERDRMKIDAGPEARRSLRGRHEVIEDHRVVVVERIDDLKSGAWISRNSGGGGVGIAPPDLVNGRIEAGDMELAEELSRAVLRRRDHVPVSIDSVLQPDGADDGTGLVWGGSALTAQIRGHEVGRPRGQDLSSYVQTVEIRRKHGGAHRRRREVQACKEEQSGESSHVHTVPGTVARQTCLNAEKR